MIIVMDEPYFDFSIRRNLYGANQRAYEEKMEEAFIGIVQIQSQAMPLSSGGYDISFRRFFHIQIGRR